MNRYITGIVIAATLSVIGFVVTSGGEDVSKSQPPVERFGEDITASEVPDSLDQNDILRHVDKNGQQYSDMQQYLPADQYDEFFIANMIHFSEGIEQLEEMASSSTNLKLSEGAAERSANARAGVAHYKQMQKDKGYPISYGDNMLYHGAMGADSAVYFAVTSLEGLSGDEYETELLAQVIEFRKNQSTIAAVGLGLTSDVDINQRLNEILDNNNAVLDVLTKEI